MIIGNDVSGAGQGQIDWSKLKDNANFVIIQSTYGNGYYDSYFAYNRDKCRATGLPHGFYHYSYPEYNSAKDEATWFCKALYDIQPGEVLALDFEEKYSGDVVAWCKEFLDYVSQNFNGIKPLIYLNQSQMSLDWTPVINAGYGLWLASYQADGVGNTGKWSSMAMQQTSSSQVVPGIVGNVDRDVFFGDATAFKKYGYQISVVIPTPTPPATTPAPVTPQPTPTPPVITPTPPVVTPVTPVPVPAIDYKSYLLAIQTAMLHGWFWQKLAAVNKIIAASGV